MTIEELIKHCEEACNEKHGKAHSKLIGWLEELKESKVVELWVARDFYGGVTISPEQLIRLGEFYYPKYLGAYIELDEELFPDLIFENSPRKIRLIKENEK